MNRPTIGSSIDGKFKLLGLLGEGGLGAVYRAEQTDLNRLAAVKLIHNAADNENQIRFEREARILAALTNEHIVRIYSFGKLDGGTPYIAMEFVDGKTLQERLQNGSLPWKRVVEIGMELCDGLETAHAAGIVHRDLKPQNIILAKASHKASGELVKILDFGLSKVTHGANESEVQRLTQTGALIGSVHYMSPEICSGQAADRRSDIYAVGCILFQCLTGHPPFDCDNPVGLLHKHRSEAPPRIAENTLNGAPKELEFVILKAIEKKPDYRFQTASEMGETLRLIAENRSSEIDLSEFAEKLNNKAPNKSLVMLPALLALLVTGIIGLIAWKNTSARTPATEIVSTSDRQSNIDFSNKLIMDAEKSSSLTEQQKIRLIQKVLRTIGHRYDKQFLNQEFALEDLNLLSRLKALGKGVKTNNKEELSKVLQQIRSNDESFLQSNYNQYAASMATMETLFGIPADGITILGGGFDVAWANNDLQSARQYISDAWENVERVSNQAQRRQMLCRLYEREIPFLIAAKQSDEAIRKTREWEKQIKLTYMPGNIYRCEALGALLRVQDSLNLSSDAKDTIKLIAETLRVHIAMTADPSLWAGRLITPNMTDDEAVTALTKIQSQTKGPALKPLLDQQITSLALGPFDEGPKAKAAQQELLVSWAYRHLLDRKPNEAELANYRQLAENGNSSLKDLLKAISLKPEFKQKLRRMSPTDQLNYLYKQLMDRKPDPVGSKAFLPRLKNGQLDFIFDLIILSDEFQETCEKLEKTAARSFNAQTCWTYNRVLGRFPSSAEMQQELKNHKPSKFSFERALQRLETSAEFAEKIESITNPKDRVNYLYKHSLGREADAAELESAYKKLQDDQAHSYSGLYTILTTSKEFHEQLKLLPFSKGCKDLEKGSGK